MPAIAPTLPAQRGVRLFVEPAATVTTVREAQALRFRVFSDELAGFMHLHGCDYLFGRAGIPLGADAIQAAAIMKRVRRQGHFIERLDGA